MGKVGNVCVKLFEWDVININGGSLYFFFNLISMFYWVLWIMNYVVIIFCVVICIRNIIKIIFFV